VREPSGNRVKGLQERVLDITAHPGLIFVNL